MKALTNERTNKLRRRPSARQVKQALNLIPPKERTMPTDPEMTRRVNRAVDLFGDQLAQADTIRRLAQCLTAWYESQAGCITPGSARADRLLYELLTELWAGATVMWAATEPAPQPPAGERGSDGTN